MARKTPWADGCCGPMFMVRRSLPPYPISMTLRASGSLIFLCRLPLASPRGAVRLARCAFHRPLASPRGAARLARPSLHRRVRGGQEHDGLHVGEQPDGLADESLPVGVLSQFGAGRGAVVEIPEHPHVHDLVELGDLGGPHADATHELRAY